MGELGLDLVEEILVRSGAKDLLQYKSVRKSCHSIILSRHFVNSHLNYNYHHDGNNNDKCEFGHTRIVMSNHERDNLGFCQRWDIVGSSYPMALYACYP